MSEEKADAASQEAITPSSPRFVEGLIEEWSSFSPASRALDDLSPELAVTRLEHWPHSIAEIVAHMLCCQHNEFQTIETGSEPEARGPGSNWPAVSEADWPRLRDEFLATLEQSKTMARDPALLERPILGGEYSVGARLVWFTGHNAHHLGQIVFMRRVLGAWPPPGGGRE